MSGRGSGIRRGWRHPPTESVCDRPQTAPTRLALLEGFTIHAVTDEMKTLAHRYVEKDVFAIKVFNDALHVAAAVLTRQDMLVSWNFKHLVNRQRRAKINDINISLGLPTIEILPPPEV